MNRLKIIFLIFVIASFIGCTAEDWKDPPYDPINFHPFYINNSGVTIKLISKEESDIMLEITRHELNNNDTLCNQYLGGSCGDLRFYWQIKTGYEGDESIGNYGDKPTYFKIEFLTVPKVCLVFDGYDKLDNDIRYWENYFLIKESNEKHHYYAYIITPEHRAIATEENCEDSISE